MSVEVNNESGVAVDEPELARLGGWLLNRLGINPMAELSVVLVDAEAMAALHQQWMDLSGPTDVMAFPMDGEEFALDDGDRVGPGGRTGFDSPALLGDIVLCPQVAASQAAAAGHTVEDELHLLCTHGLLHLLGYEHDDADTERQMFDLQARLVTEWAAATGRGAIQVPRAGTGGEVRDTVNHSGGHSGRSR
jgi:probable rRNA maturation factor